MRRDEASTPRYRWVILAVLWVTLLVSYFDRVAMASALPFLSRDLGLTPAAMGLVSGALLLSYTLVQVPAGALSDRFGQRRVIAVAILWWTVFSVLTGAVGEGVLLLAGTVGLLVGAVVCERWFPGRRRSFIVVGNRATAVCSGATALATTTALAGAFLTAAGFFLYSGLGPFWSVPMDLVAPHEVGTWLGFINMGTQIAGFVGPVLIGQILQATGSFTPVLAAMIVALVLASGCLAAVRVPAGVPVRTAAPA